MAENRRSFFKTAGAGAAALALGNLMAGRVRGGTGSALRSLALVA